MRANTFAQHKQRSCFTALAHCLFKALALLEGLSIEMMWQLTCTDVRSHIMPACKRTGAYMALKELVHIRAATSAGDPGKRLERLCQPYVRSLAEKDAEAACMTWCVMHHTMAGMVANVRCGCISAAKHRCQDTFKTQMPGHRAAGEGCTLMSSLMACRALPTARHLQQHFSEVQT